MKLQINARGSWRDVAEFEAEQLRAVQEAAVPLAQALSIGAGDHRGASWRITKTVSRSPKIVGYLAPPRFSWRKP